MSHQSEAPDAQIETGVSPAALAEQLMALAEQWCEDSGAAYQAQRWHEAHAQRVDADRLRKCADLIRRRARDGRTA